MLNMTMVSIELFSSFRVLDDFDKFIYTRIVNLFIIYMHYFFFVIVINLFIYYKFIYTRMEQTYKIQTAQGAQVNIPSQVC